MTNTTEDQKVTRRSVVRIGANAAWAVPAIAIVGAAPAIACSTTSTGFNVTALAAQRGTGGAKKDVTGSFSVKNDKQVGALTPSISVTITGGLLNAIPVISGYGAGTGALTPTGGTFTYSGSSSVAACTSLTSNISYSYKTSTSGGSVQVSVTPANNTGATSLTDSAL